jgi:hypothetical protein
MRFELTEDQNVMSEMVHDLGSSEQEILCHYLHYFLMGKINKDELQEAFDSCVRDGIYIPNIWDTK